MYGIDTDEEIKRCLSCGKAKCDNCLKHTHISGKPRIQYSVISRMSGELLVAGTAEECAAYLGVRVRTFRDGVANKGNKKYIFSRRYH